MGSWFPYCGASSSGRETRLIQRTFVDPPRPDSFILLFICLLSTCGVPGTTVGSKRTAVKKVSLGTPQSSPKFILW